MSDQARLQKLNVIRHMVENRVLRFSVNIMLDLENVVVMGKKYKPGIIRIQEICEACDEKELCIFNRLNIGIGEACSYLVEHMLSQKENQDVHSAD